MLKSITSLAVCAVLGWSNLAFSMEELDEAELGEISGAGVGFFVDNFLYDQAGATAQIGGLKDSAGNAVNINITKGYIKGEGSSRGANDVVANVGSPAHPFILDVATPAEVPTLPIGKQALRLRTPTYTDPLNDTRQYGLWSFYQGCVYGESGCTSANTAVTNVNTELLTLKASRDALITKYSNNFVALKSGINTDMQAVNTRQATVNTERTQVAVAYNGMADAYQYVPNTYIGWSKPRLGEKYECGACWFTPDSIDTYNARVDSWNNEQQQLSDAQKALSQAWEKTDVNGVSLNQRVIDYELFVSLCGAQSGSTTTCSSGSIADGESNKIVVNGVAVALNNGGQRVKGLDIGLETQFSLPSYAYDANGVRSASPTTRNDFFNLHIEGLTLHGSYLNLWGGASGMQGEADLQFFINRIALDGCQPGKCSDANRAIVKNVYMDLRLGHATYQPLTFKMDSRGEVNLSLQGPTWSNYQAFYQNVPKSTVAIGNVSFGNGVGNAPSNVGAQIVQGMRIDYLDFKSTSLPR